MNVNQLLPTMSYGDAVSNSALTMQKCLQDMGCNSKIYAEHIHPKLSHIVLPASKIPKDEAVIYHMAIGCDLAYIVPEFTDRRMLLYHNITPPHFFRGYDEQSAELCVRGREELEFLKDYIDIAYADSDYNRSELIDIGYKCTAVTPIMIDFEEYDVPCNYDLLSSLKKNKKGTDILFVGRIAPNKKQEDIIKTFYYYKKYFDQEARLFLVGSYVRMERYYSQLQDLIKQLELSDVYITGHVPFADILTYYKNADIFLSMSEHEGFCVPLLEAMKFKLPIISYKECAVPETLGNGGILVLEKDFRSVASLLKVVIDDEVLQAKILRNQQQRLEFYSKQNTTRIFKEKIKQEIVDSLG
ncbi:glycosyltransferase family 4 protein [Bacillus sp. FSL K6-6540]|uniref:glycosyltransferase family 4 protein n=1 Tax=Bacillus sp. FSL K6-6540 TaxID=2921512 RepID=UPI0030F61155